MPLGDDDNNPPYLIPQDDDLPDLIPRYCDSVADHDSLDSGNNNDDIDHVMENYK